MEIFNPEGHVILDIVPNDESSRSRELMGDDYLTITYSLSYHLELPVGCYTILDGVKYTLINDEDVTIHHSSNYAYSVVMHGEFYASKIWYFKNPIDHRLTFDLTARPHEHIQMVIDNLNMHYGDENHYTIGDVIDGTEKLVTYNFVTIWEALKTIAATFDTEFEVSSDNMVSLHKVEYGKGNPLVLAYGKDKGLKSGVSRKNKNDIPPLDVVYAQGGERNINYADYGFKTLHLPKSVSYSFDGEHFDDEEGYEEAMAIEYITDEDGASVRKKEIEHAGVLIEGAFDCTNYYPSHVCRVSSIVTDNEEKHFYDIFDASIPQELDYSEYGIPGQKMSIVFQSGMLAGREFDIHQYVHGERRFLIVPTEVDGVIMPDSSTFKPSVDDEFVVFGCSLPTAYITRKADGAEWNMLRACIRYLYENSFKSYSVNASVDEIWAKKHWGEVESKFMIGHYVRFSGDGLGESGIRLRITNIKSNLNHPHRMDISFSNSPVRTNFSDEFRRVSSNGSRNERNTQNLVNNALSEGNNNADQLWTTIEGASSPATAISNMLNTASTRFRILTSSHDNTPIENPVTYNPKNNSVLISGGYAQHQTFGQSGLSPLSKKAYRGFSLSTTETSVNSRNTTYVYIKAGREESEGEYILSEQVIGFEDDDKYIHMLVGYLLPYRNNTREFIPTYGFIGNLGTTFDFSGIITSETGGLSLDLDTGKFEIKNGGKTVIKLSATDSNLNVKTLNLDGNDIGAEFETIKTKLDEDITRSNEFNTLFDNLVNAIDRFNANNKGLSPLDFTKCIPVFDPSAQQEICKPMPDIKPL